MAIDDDRQPTAGDDPGLGVADNPAAEAVPRWAAQEKPQGSDRLRRFMSRRLLISVVGGGTVGGLIITAIMGLLPIFKLDFMKQNIDKKRMARLTHVFDQRSNRFINALVLAEVAGNNPNTGKNRYFEAKGWDGVSNPFTQWYKDMKVSGFMDQLEKEHGFRFARELGPNGRDRLVTIYTGDISSGSIDISKDLTANGGLDPSAAGISDFEKRVTDGFDTHKEARQAWHDVVKQNTHWSQVIKRRHLRKWGREKLGIRSWRFFEGTRDKANEKIRASWDTHVENSSNNSRVARCLFKGECASSNQVNDNPLDPGATEADIQQAQDDASNDTNNSGDTTDKKGVSLFKKLMATKLVQIFVKTTNVVGNLDLLSSIHHALSGGLVKTIAAARAAEYATAYFSFSTVTDHLKDGNKASGEEVNATMKMFDGIEHGDGYRDVIGSQTSAQTAIIPSAVAATSNDTPYAKVDGSFTVDAGNTTAADITDAYQGSVGHFIAPVVGAWDAVPGPAKDIARAGGAITSVAVNGAMDAFASVTGVNIADGAAWAGQKVLEGVGGTPNCTSHESAGRKFNCIDAGASVVQDQFLADAGGQPMSPRAVLQQDNAIAAEQQQEYRGESFISRLASLDNSDSLLARLVVRTPTSFGELASAGSSLIASLSPADLMGHGSGALAMLSMPTQADSSSCPTIYKEGDCNGFTEEQLKQDPFSSDTQKIDTDMAEAMICVPTKGQPQNFESGTNVCGLDDNGQAAPACDSASPSAPSGKVYILGDSIIRGSDAAGLGDQIRAAGFSNVTIDGSTSRAIEHGGQDGNRLSGLDAVDHDKSDIKDAGVIVINLGANTDTNYKSSADKLVKKIKAVNSSAPIYWVNIVSTINKTAYDNENKDLKDLSTSAGFTVIDAASANVELDSGKIHPTAAGYKTYIKAIVDGLKGTPAGDCAGATTIPSGDDQQLAKQIVQLSSQGKIIYPLGPAPKEAFQLIANGKNPKTDTGREVKVNPLILQAIVYLAQHGTLGVNSLVDGAHHTAATNPHGSGNAVDIGSFDGTTLGGGSQAQTKKVEELLADVLPAQSRFGADFYSDSNWSTPITIKGKRYLTGNDSGGHLHFDVVGVGQ